AEVQEKAKAEGVTLSEHVEEDALINGLFVQIGWKFLANRGNPDAFEPAPDPEAFAAANAAKDTAVESYTVNVNGQNFNVAVGPGGENLSIAASAPAASGAAPVTGSGAVVESPLAGNIFKVLVSPGSVVAEGDIVLIMEAMKMETEVRSKVAGTISAVNVKAGDAVAVGDILVSL
ncbi:MAG: biotin/lipoyl-binding protein, partial [Methyloprofundus sp.]|nr:biotin/lipoyl-binding protein [Methyloprofundus sp.]